ncbi:MAG: hypothetical protein LBQ59_04405 [Candidatus Peribacteria bacterium]|jgi:hypothetical protein|nr:hypothetical protein [Candidatus Peribacteria bacterium]
MYLELSNFEANSETNVNTLISRIIKTHIDIVDAIDILTEACQQAVQVCKQQDPER